MEHVVMRPFREDGVDLKPGQSVDTTDWPNVPLLEQQRYLRAAAPEAPNSNKKGGQPGARRSE